MKSQNLRWEGSKDKNGAEGGKDLGEENALKTLGQGQFMRLGEIS